MFLWAFLKDPRGLIKGCRWHLKSVALKIFNIIVKKKATVKWKNLAVTKMELSKYS